jgi:ribose transport system substrate-binding protein
MLSKISVARRMGVLVGLCAALVASGCSSSNTGSGNSSSGSSSAGGGSSASGVQAAKAKVAEISVPAKTFTAQKPLASKPPTGKHIVFIQPKTLGLDAIKSGDELTEASKLVGWTVQRLPVAGDVPSVQQGIEQALQLKPDGIMLWTGASVDELQGQLDEAKQAKVPVWLGATDLPDQLPFPIVGGQGGTQTRARQSDGIAAWIASDSNCNKVHAAYVNLRENAAVVKFGENVRDALKKYCPNGQYSDINNGLSDIGQRLPNNVVSAIQSDPSINYIVTSAGAFLAGVPAALQAAGLQDKVKITGTNPADADMAAVKSGEGFPWATIESSWFGWYAVDSFSRYFTNTPLVTEAQDPDPLLLLTKDNYTDSQDGKFFTKNGQSRDELVKQFSAEWHLSG